MTGLLVVQGMVFALWVVLAFRCLFRLLRIVQQKTGQPLPGPRGTAMVPRLFWTDPRLATDRKLLGLVTVLLLALSAGFAALR